MHHTTLSVMRKISLIFLIPVILFVSCDEESLDLQANIETASEYVLGQEVFFDVFNYVDKALRDSVLMANGSSVIDAAQATYSAGTLTLDFGNGVQCPDGKTRSGSISAFIGGDYSQDTVSAAVQFSSYTVGAKGISGLMNLEKDFSTANKDLMLQVIGGQLSEGSDTTQWACDYTLRWLAGDTTFNEVGDDIYAILAGGSVDGTAYNGQSFDVSVTSDLIFDRSCKWIGEGLLDISLPGAVVENGEIDFGNGACDDKVTFLFDGSSIPYYMN